MISEAAKNACTSPDSLGYFRVVPPVFLKVVFLSQYVSLHEELTQRTSFVAWNPFSDDYDRFCSGQNAQRRGEIEILLLDLPN